MTTIAAMELVQLTKMFGSVIAVDAINKPAEFLGAKMLIQKGKTIAPEVLQDTSKPMKELVAAAG